MTLVGWLHPGHSRQVMPEQGWSKAETIDSLVRKSGYSSTISDSLRARIALTRFRSTKMTCSYEQWAAQRRFAPKSN